MSFKGRRERRRKGNSSVDALKDQDSDDQTTATPSLQRVEELEVRNLASDNGTRSTQREEETAKIEEDVHGKPKSLVVKTKEEDARVGQDVEEILKSLDNTKDDDHDDDADDDDAGEPTKKPKNEDPPPKEPAGPRKMEAVKCLCGTMLSIREGETQKCSSCGKKVSVAEMEAWKKLMDVWEHDAARGIVPDISSFLPVRSALFKDSSFPTKSPEPVSPISPHLLPSVTVAMLLPAARDGDTVVVAAALGNRDIDINVTGDHGSTAILLAALYAQTAVVKLLLADERVDLNHTNDYGYVSATTKEIKKHNHQLIAP